jgi:hypothetical protein
VKNGRSTVMDRTVLASRLVEIAKDLAALTEGKTGCGDRGILEAQALVSEALNGISKMAVDAVSIDRMPGFSPMQLRQHVNRIAEVSQQLKVMQHQWEAVLKQMQGLEDEEKAGISKLQDAARNMKEKGKFLVDAENALLEFTAFCQDKRPGIEQMLANPETVKSGLKAGDFFNRVGTKLGKEVQDAIETIYRETAEDLTHTADMVRGLKIVAKTVAVKTATLHTAGLADVLISMKDWLAGKNPDSLVAKLIGFAGDISRFVRGFVERTGLVKQATRDLESVLADAMKQVQQEMN